MLSLGTYTHIHIDARIWYHVLKATLIMSLAFLPHKYRRTFFLRCKYHMVDWLCSHPVFVERRDQKKAFRKKGNILAQPNVASGDFATNVLVEKILKRVVRPINYLLSVSFLGIGTLHRIHHKGDFGVLWKNLRHKEVTRAGEDRISPKVP